MDRRTFIDILRCEEPWRSPGWALLRGALWLAGIPYATAMRVRRWAYRKGILPSTQTTVTSKAAHVGVISVGNITTGGTGKTPMVAWIVRELQKAGRHPGIVLRGYKSRRGKSDEAELLRRLTGAVVVTNADRVAGAGQAVESGADVIVLDDGFQHRRLRRDLDVALIDATDPFGLGHCLPRGLLREPPSALADAQVIVVTRSDAVGQAQLDELRRALVRLSPRAAICLAVHRPAAAIDPAGRRLDPSVLAGKRVFAFSGIGNPRGFPHTLGQLGARVAGHRVFEDHCEYSPQRLAEIAALANKTDAEIIVTTQKDFVKIDPKQLTLPLWQLEIEMDVIEGREEFVKAISSAS